MRTLKEIEEKPKLSDVKDLLAEVKRLMFDCADLSIRRDRAEEELADMTADRDRIHSELTKLRCVGCARPRRWRFLRNEAVGK